VATFAPCAIWHRLRRLADLLTVVSAWRGRRVIASRRNSSRDCSQRRRSPPLEFQTDVLASPFPPSLGLRGDAPPWEVGPERISRRGASDQPAFPANCDRNVACVAHAIVIGPFELAAPGPGSSKAPKTRARSLGCDSLSAQANLLPICYPSASSWSPAIEPRMRCSARSTSNALVATGAVRRPRQLVAEAAERRLATARRGRP
jgi:hypothetical protein